MKKIKILLLILCVTISFTVNSQNKVAHINTEEVLMLMPATKKAQIELENLSKTFREQIQDQSAEVQALQSRYQAEVNEQTEEENIKRGKEIQEMIVSIRNFEAEADKEFQRKQVEMMTPVEKEIMDAINKIARAQGLEYVFQYPMQGLLVAKGKDITEDVKIELGI